MKLSEHDNVSVISIAMNPTGVMLLYKENNPLLKK